MDIYLKTQNDIQEIIKILNTWCDFSWKNFLTPVEWWVLASFLKNNPEVEIQNLTTDTKNFLYRIWLFQSLSIPYVPDNYKTHPHDHIIDLMLVNSELECEKIAAAFCRTCNIQLWERRDQFFQNLEKIISEIATNIVHHARAEETWFACWMYYKKTGVLQIAIVDSWIWIKDSLTRAYPKLDTHKDAIKKSLEREITWNIETWLYTTQTRNAWCWLTLSSRWIVLNWGDFFICSWDYLFWQSLWGGEKREQWEYIKQEYRWDWTIVVFNLYASKDNKQSMWEVWDLIFDDTMEEPVDFYINFW